jgi:hypothetical protein
MALLRGAGALRRAAIVLAIATSVAGLGAETQAPPPRLADEYRLKAAIIYSLAKFVEWPAAAFADPSSPLTVCVLGADPFGPALEAAMAGRSVTGRGVVTRRIANLEAGCHVLFVSDSETKRLPVILDQLRGQSVLSIGEDHTFLDLGGIVGLSRRGDRVIFSISGDAAEQAHLKVSARVLALSVASNRSQGVAP